MSDQQRVNYNPQWTQTYIVPVIALLLGSMLAFSTVTTNYLKPRRGALWFYYLPTYAKTAMISGGSTVRLIYIHGHQGVSFARDPYLAPVPKGTTVDVRQPRLMLSTEGLRSGAQWIEAIKIKTIPNEESALNIQNDAQAYLALSGRLGKLSNWDVHLILRYLIYGGESLWRALLLPFLASLFVLFGGLPLLVRFIRKRNHELRKGRLLRGPNWLRPAEFQAKVKGDGVGILLEE